MTLKEKRVWKMSIRKKAILEKELSLKQKIKRAYYRGFYFDIQIDSNKKEFIWISKEEAAQALRYNIRLETGYIYDEWYRKNNSK